MNEPSLTRGARWFRALAGETATAAPVWSGDGPRSAEPLSARDR
jgi:malonate decarboxylase gamma subunit